MKLVSKERVGGIIKRKYDRPQTPYQRVMEADDIANIAKNTLREIYLSLNPAKLKREIDAKLDKLYSTYQKKNNSPKVDMNKKNTPQFG